MSVASILRTIRRPTRRGLVRALAAVLLAGFVLGGLAQLRMETSVSSFLPEDDPVVARLDEVARSFGGDPIVVLVEGDQKRRQLDEQHLLPLLALEGRLSRQPGVATVYGPGTVLNQVAGHMQNLLAELTGRRDAIRAKDGEAGVRAFDKRYGSLLVQGLPAGLPTLRNSKFIDTVVFNADGTPKPQWRFVVPDAETVAVLVRPRQGLDERGTAALVDSVRSAVDGARLDAERVTVTGVPVVASELSRQVQSEIPVLAGLAVVAVGACFVLVPWAPRRRRLLPVVIALIAIAATVAVFGWLGRPVSLGVLAFLSVLLGIGSYYPIYLAQQARRRVVVAVVLATAGGFATLMLSPLPFVRDLGMTLAVGVVVSAAVGSVLLGWVHRGDTTPEHDEPPADNGPQRNLGVRATVVALAAVAAAGGWLALPSMPLDGSFHRFAAGVEALGDAERAESVLGASGELDIVLRGDDVLSPVALGWAKRAHDAVLAAHGDQLRPVLSPARLLSFLGREPSEAQIRAGVRLLPSYLTGAVFRSDGHMSVSSFGVHFDDLGRLQTLRDGILATLPEPPPGYRAEVTGLPMAAVRGNELISDHRILSNTSGIVAAGLVLALLLSRRRSDAGRAVLAAAIATGAGLGVLWLTGVALTPLTVTLGSLTAAVACEFTVVLAEARRRGNRALRRSVLLAMGASAAGYAVLAASGLPAIREFGILLAGSVVLSMASAWLVTWAITPNQGQPPLARIPLPVSDKVEMAVR